MFYAYFYYTYNVNFYCSGYAESKIALSVSNQKYSDSYYAIFSIDIDDANKKEIFVEEINCPIRDIKYRDGWIYYTNTENAKSCLYSIIISKEGYKFADTIFDRIEELAESKIDISEILSLLSNLAVWYSNRDKIAMAPASVAITA